MNLVLLREDDFVDADKVRLEGRRMRHILEVHRVTTGDELSVGLRNGLTGSGIVTALTADSVVMEVSLTREPPPPLPVTLVLALPRPKVLKRVLISATSMGVKRFYLINAFRVEKSYWQSPALTGETLEEQLVLGLEQACDTVMPEVHLRHLFRPFVEDELPEIARGTVAIAADPSGSSACPRGIGGRITLAVGPEGGFIPYETGKLSSCGFSAVHLGERILRVETAVPALLSRLF